MIKNKLSGIARTPEDDVLLHPAVQAVMILCEQSKA